MAGAVAQSEAQARHFERVARQVHDHAFDHQHHDTVMEFALALDVLEDQAAQIDRHPQHREQRSGLREMPHHRRAPLQHTEQDRRQSDDQHRQAERAAAAAVGLALRSAWAWRARRAAIVSMSSRALGIEFRPRTAPPSRPDPRARAAARPSRRAPSRLRPPADRPAASRPRPRSRLRSRCRTPPARAEAAGPWAAEPERARRRRGGGRHRLLEHAVRAREPGVLAMRAAHRAPGRAERGGPI